MGKQRRAKRKRFEQEVRDKPISQEAAETRAKKIFAQQRKRQKILEEETARNLLNNLERYPDSLFRVYNDVDASAQEALKALLLSEKGTLSPEVQKQFQCVLQPSPIVETVARKAFSAPYYGDGPARFYKALDKIHRNEQFSRVADMFQASGWGKSRLVKELHGQGVWVVYLSLGTGTCYPKRSLFADEFETTLRKKIGHGGLAGEVQCMNYCLTFWICCIRAVVDLSSCISRAEFAGMMTDDCGKDFWPLVKELMRTEPARISTGCPALPEGENRFEFLNSWDNAAATVFTNEASKSLQKLCGSSERLKLLFVIDEARQLLPYQSRGEFSPGRAENLYLPVRRSTRALQGAMVLLMDTNSRVAKFPGPEWKYPSARLQKPAPGFFLPTPLVGFFVGDVERKQRSRAVKTFKDITDDHEMVSFGRPLWWSLYEAASPNSRNAALDTVIALAMVKLTGQGTPHLCKSDEALIAIVGSRCGLYVHPSSQLVVDLVAGHGMTVLYVSPDRSRVYGAWPVEPLVGEAAYEAMRAIKEDRVKGYRFLYEPIQRNLSEGLLNAGEPGDLIGRIILLEAIDNVRGRVERAWITVEEFLRELFGSTIVEEWMESGAAYQKEKLQVLLHGKILVNAFHRVYKSSSELSAEDTKVALEARCGIVAAAAEFFIVVHLGGLDVPLERTLLHLKVKTHERCGSIQLAKLSSQYSGITFLRPGVPYMCLVVNLVGQKKVVLKHSHAVWEAVANSQNKEIRAALKSLEENGTMDKLRKDVKALVGEECKSAQTQKGKKKGSGEPKQKGKEKSSGECEAAPEQRDKVSKEQAAHKRWQDWIQADWSDQIIVRARGLDSLNLNEELKACLVDMLSIQMKPTTMQSLKPPNLSALEESRLAVTQKNWELQQGFRNVEQRLWQKQS